MFDAPATAVTIKYLDIKLQLFFLARGRRGEGNEIHIMHLERGHYIREHPGMQVLTKEGDPASEPGDGALFLALAVFHCNSLFGRDIEWRISPGCWNNWWKRKSGISVQHSVTQDDAGLDVYKIKREDFLSWAEKKISDHQRAHQGLTGGGKKKRRYKRTNKKRKKRKTRRKSKKRRIKSKKRRRKRKKRKTKKRRR